MKTLVLGLGNPLLGDDSIGVVAVRKLKEMVKNSDITIEESTGGFDMLERMLGYDKVILVDALTSTRDIGKVKKLTPNNFKGESDFSNIHSLNPLSILEMGMAIDDRVPKNIVIIGVNTKPDFKLGEGLSPETKSAMPKLIHKVLEECTGNKVIKKW